MPGKPLIILLVSCLFANACTWQKDQVPETYDLSACHIIYDAGSKGTRLYIYEETDSGWLKHSGPRTVALADPVRKIRGKTMDDAEEVVESIVAALDGMRSDGPVNKDGKPGWQAFEWRRQCDVQSVSVYATAGMRLAEQMDYEASESLWNLLNQHLGAAVGMAVTTRTLNGFEEGLYAWLAVRESQVDDSFGIAEMGGASVQVAFPCPHCQSARQVRVKDQQVAIYSHSFISWGQDEAWKKFGSSEACTRGAGIDHPGWKVADCSVGIYGFTDAAVVPAKRIDEAGIRLWYLGGAFRYMKDDDIQRFCRAGVDSGYEPVSSCFRAVYLSRVLETLGLPANAEPTDADWTLGAVVCKATQCLGVQ